MPYPTPPGPRLAYDLDGTVVLISQYDGALSMLDMAPAAVKALNSDRSSGVQTFRTVGATSVNDGVWQSNASSREAFTAYLFPVPTRLRGIYPAVVYQSLSSGPSRWAGSADVYTSTNTTNGLDGTWTLVATNLRAFSASPVTQVLPDTLSSNLGKFLDGTWYANINQTALLPVNNDAYRRLMAMDGVGITALAGTGTRYVRGLRINYHSTPTPPAPGVQEWGPFTVAQIATHIYGEVDSVDEDRLAMWRPDLDVEAPTDWFNWGDTPLSSSADKSFRIKNMSGDLTATDISLHTSASFVNGTAGFAAPSTMFVYSNDNRVTWHTDLTIAALSPGATSGTLWIRRTVPADAPLSNWSPRVIAEVDTWA